MLVSLTMILMHGGQAFETSALKKKKKGTLLTAVT
jgi:hypothetical protein